MRLSYLSAVSMGSWVAVSCAGLLGGCANPAPAPAAAQWAPDSATVRLAPGPQYARGRAWRFWWGTHYRAIWAQPVVAPVLRLATGRPGGLLVVQAGGSFQSRTLRLRDSTGTEYMLRSVDKDGSAALPAGWIRGLLGGLMKDQTSAGLPYGAYIAARLAQSAGVYHTNPRLVYLANDPGLGSFRRGYANALYLLEERPDGRQVAQPSFGRSAEVVNTRRLLSRARRRPGHHVAARAYLRARLLDMWLGDWSRREDQWRWATFRGPTGAVSYRPIPRDRDQAFFLFDDGLITGAVAALVPKYCSFHSSISPGAVDGLTRTARALDRTLLATLPAEAFRQEADSLVLRLSDAAIATALAAAPPETRPTIAARLEPRLRARRAQLPAVARQYYRLLAQEAWAIGTDQPERFVLSAGPGGQLRLQLLLRKAPQPDSLLFERLYAQPDTQHLNLYGLAGDDIFELKGPLPAGIRVGIYDGAGHDVLQQDAPGAATQVVWYHGNDADGKRAAPGITSKTDPHPELTKNSAAWLLRYKLRD